jgi:methylthioxylose transferase
MPTPVTARGRAPFRLWAPDAVAVGGAALLVGLAAVGGRALLARGHELFLPFPPLLATWEPHVGPGTPVAITVAALVALRGPELAARLRWAALLGSAYAAAAAWIIALALVDGWQRGVVERLTSTDEYLHDVGRVTDIPAMLATFADHIRTDAPGFWTTHVGAHPPGALLLFVVLDRIGLGGGGPSGVVVMLVAASACVAVAVTLRALGAEDVARRALPFGVLLPGAVWMGVSADGLFAAALAWGVALLALGATGRDRRPDLCALAGGLLLGGCLYLSYGLVVAGLIPLAVLLLTRSRRAGVLATVGVAAVVLGFTAAGFWWFTGFAHLRVIYAASAAADRPYAYFVWANLAALLLALGPAVVAGLRRVAADSRALPVAAVALAGAALAAVLVADVSGMSKAEVERIWLPFAIWLAGPCALLPRARSWLAAQAVLALAVNHLLFTVW